jgi:hypothetical protein
MPAAAHMLQVAACAVQYLPADAEALPEAVPQPALNLPALVMACGRYVPLKDADISNGKSSKSRMLKVVPGTTSVGIMPTEGST